MFKSLKLSLALAFAISSACLALPFLTAGQVGFSPWKREGSPYQDDKPSPSNNYKFSEPAPSGNWSAVADIDMAQTNDPTVPVVVAGVSSYAGKGNWRRQLMIETVTLKNHTAKTVTTVRLGWIILSDQFGNTVVVQVMPQTKRPKYRIVPVNQTIGITAISRFVIRSQGVESVATDSGGRGRLGRKVADILYGHHLDPAILDTPLTPRYHAGFRFARNSSSSDVCSSLFPISLSGL